MSCRTGPLRAGRSLRNAYTGLGKMSGIGPPVGRKEDLSFRPTEGPAEGVYTSRSDRPPRRRPVRQGMIFYGFWSGRRGSNPQPTAWEAATLPLSYSRFCPYYNRQSPLPYPSLFKPARASPIQGIPEYPTMGHAVRDAIEPRRIRFPGTRLIPRLGNRAGKPTFCARRHHHITPPFGA